MCGIVGAACAGEAPPLDEIALLRMRDAVAHRGPDDAGHFLGPGIALGSRRLAILDLSERGHMPMATPDRRYWIVYNGEVYNYRELRTPLEARGFRFRSNSDTEVLLALYVDAGAAMLERLNGMFAFAIWDTRERTLFVARDRLGVKPLYYARQHDVLLFASEEKALFVAGVPLQFDTDTWPELLRFGYVAGERTPFLGVRRLLPGHYLRWQDGRVETRRWWSLADRVATLRGNLPRGPLEWFRETFDDAVNLRRISDVPVGVLLSGGLDSSSVASSLAAQAGNGIASFTVRFDDRSYDEGPLARLVAEQWKLDGHELTVPRDHLYQGLLDASWFNDEPLAHYSDLHVRAISQYAKSRVTVLLSGEGADETLGGYVRYWPLRHRTLLTAARLTVPWLADLVGAQRLRKLRRMLSLGGTDQMVLFNASNVFPDDLAAIGVTGGDRFPFREQVVRESREVYPGEPARQAMYADLHTFLCSLLDRNDRMTMSASIECRVPFLDYRLVEGLGALPSSLLLRGRRGKWLLRHAVGDRLPGGIRRARKWGFSVPWARYLREDPDLRAVVAGLPDCAAASGPLNRQKLKYVVKDFLAGGREREALVVSVFMLAVWHDEYPLRLAEARRATPLANAGLASWRESQRG
jgi:asparagine synthase (glutamine-hydrolysing)